MSLLDSLVLRTESVPPCCTNGQSAETTGLHRSVGCSRQLSLLIGCSNASLGLYQEFRLDPPPPEAHHPPPMEASQMTKQTPRWKETFSCIGKDCGKKVITGPDSYRLHLINVHKFTPAKAVAQRDKQRQEKQRSGPKSRKIRPAKTTISVVPAT